jgi:hypothetical protein
MIGQISLLTEIQGKFIEELSSNLLDFQEEYFHKYDEILFFDENVCPF